MKVTMVPWPFSSYLDITNLTATISDDLCHQISASVVMYLFYSIPISHKTVKSGYR